MCVGEKETSHALSILAAKKDFWPYDASKSRPSSSSPEKQPFITDTSDEN